MRTVQLHVLVIVCLLLAACAGSETVPSATPEPATRVAPTETNTPPPTSTPRPTRTPRPTATATPLPEVEVFTGSGDSVVDIDFGGGPYILHITGNAAGRYFAVENYDGSGERMGLLVNTTEPYDGRCSLDWFDRDYTRRLLVTAVGEWAIEAAPLAPIPEVYDLVLDLPGTREGSGDDMILFLGQEPDIAEITGNAAARYFGITSWGGPGRRLLVLATDPYEGTKILPENTIALEIEAIGPWTIEVTERQP